MLDYDTKLNQLNYLLLEIEALTSFANLSPENSKKSRVLGKSVEKIVSELISTNDGIEVYTRCLHSDNNALKWNAGLNLFPLYPNMCISSLKECEKECNDKLVKSSMNDVITAYKKGLNEDNVFIERLKKLYAHDNLLELCKE